MIKFYKIPYNQRFFFNCGGFALGTCKWEHFDCYDKQGYEPFGGRTNKQRYRAMSRMTWKCAQEMLAKYPRQLRLIKSEDEKLSYEEVFFFRLSSDGDFHFVLKHGRKYFHKRGNIPRLNEMSKEEVYSSAWCGRYDGPILIFAKTKKPFVHKDFISEHDRKIIELLV